MGDLKYVSTHFSDFIYVPRPGSRKIFENEKRKKNQLRNEINGVQ